jgi:lipoate-protein ligase A
VKIREGVDILYSTFKARGGLIRTAQEVKEGVIRDISISGDFQMFPTSQLNSMEHELKGADRKEKTIETKLEDFYDRAHVESPGVRPGDIKDAIMEAR